jgi:hypothetical protein
MKNKINLFLFLVIGCIGFSQQNNTSSKIKDNTSSKTKDNTSSKTKSNVEVISFDFSNKKHGFSLPNEIKEGQFFVIEIDNINMNLWDISFSTKDTVLTKALKTPTFEDISFSNLSSLVSSFNDLTAFSTAKSVESKCSELNSDNFKLHNDLSKNYTLLEQVKEEFRSIKNNLLIYELDLLKENGKTDKTYDYQNVISQIEIITNTLEDSRLQLVEKKNEYSSKIVNNDYNDCFAKDATIKKKFEKNLEIVDAFSLKIIEFKDQLSSDKIAQLFRKVHFLKNDKNKYTSLPIQFSGEYTTVNLKITPKETEYNEQTYESKFTFPLETKDWYLSLSTSFYLSGLHNDRFSIVGDIQNDTTTVYNVVKEKNDNYEIGIATMLKYGQKFGANKNMGGHFSFGPGINIGSSVRPRLLFGAGLSFGKKHAFSIDVGGIFGYVDRKSNAINLDSTYLVKPEDLTVTQLKFNGFLALGYLFRM